MNYLGAGFILLSNDLTSVLLVHDARSQKWGFPKGHRESADSSDIETATRECFEETGYYPDTYTIYPESFKINKGSHSYLFRYARMNICIEPDATLYGGDGREIDDVRWVPIRVLLEADNVLDGNKYLRTWVTDLRSNTTKKSVQLFMAILTAAALESIVAVPPAPSPVPSAAGRA